MIKSGKFISVLLLSSALICAAIPSQSLQAQTVTITKEAISDNLYCVTELVETSDPGIQPFSTTQTKSGMESYIRSRLKCPAIPRQVWEQRIRMFPQITSRKET